MSNETANDFLNQNTGSPANKSSLYITRVNAQTYAKMYAQEQLRDFCYFVDNNSKSGDANFSELQKFAEQFIFKMKGNE